MFKFTLDSIKRMGEPDPKFGAAYWCTSPDVDFPIKFNSMEINLHDKLADGPINIVAEEKTFKKSKEYTDDEGNQKGGNEYIALKKVRVADRVAEPSQGGSQSGNAGHHIPETPSGTSSVAQTSNNSVTAQIVALLTTMNSKLDKLLNNDVGITQRDTGRDWSGLGKKDTVHEVPDEPVNLDEIPPEFL